MHFRQRLRTIVQFYHGDAFLLFPVSVTMPRSESGQLPDAGAAGDDLDMLNGSYYFQPSLFARSPAGTNCKSVKRQCIDGGLG